MNKEERDIFKNLVDFYTELAIHSGYDSGKFSGLDYVWNMQGTWPAYIFGKPDVKQAEALNNEIKERHLPPFWIMDDEGDKMLIEYLDERDIRSVRKWTGMILNTKSYRKEVLAENISLKVDSSEDLPFWRSLINEGLFSANHMGEEIEKTLNKGDRFTWVVARIDDQPVASGLLYTKSRISGIYMIVTKKSFRGRGIGTMVTRSLIERSLECGIDRIVLHATQLGEGIYRNLGFEPINELSIYWKLGY